jgi:hypothetical protein
VTTVKVQGHTAAVDLSESVFAIVYGNSVMLTAHLRGYGSNHSVSIYREDPSGPVLVASGPVDGTGIFTANVAPKKNATFYASYQGDTATEPATSSSVYVGVAPTIAIKAHAKRTTVRQFVRHGEQVIIAILVNPGASLGSPCQLQVQWSLNKRRWRTVAGGSFMAVAGTGYVGFKTKLPGFYRAQVKFGGNPNYLPASSAWAKFKAPTVL